MILKQNEVNEMSIEHQKRYHERCWFKGYGNCDDCAIDVKLIYPPTSDNSSYETTQSEIAPSK